MFIHYLDADWVPFFCHVMLYHWSFLLLHCRPLLQWHFTWWMLMAYSGKNVWLTNTYSALYTIPQSAATNTIPLLGEVITIDTYQSNLALLLTRELNFQVSVIVNYLSTVHRQLAWYITFSWTYGITNSYKIMPFNCESEKRRLSNNAQSR